LPASDCEGLYSAHENDFPIFILLYVGEEGEVRYLRENRRFEILKISHTTTTAIPAIAVAATASRSQAQFETMLYILFLSSMYSMVSNCACDRDAGAATAIYFGIS
jgi:hypothetical protein